VSFDPASPGARSAELVFTFNANGSPIRVPIRANGVTRPPPTTDPDPSDDPGLPVPGDDPGTGGETPSAPGAPVIVVNPASGPPGTEATVVGLGWPAGATVSIVFAGPPETTATAIVGAGDAEGRFEVAMLILPRSQLGPRLVTATTPVVFGPPIVATTTFLSVVPSVDGGNDFVFRR
jgi:hypothetical protein